MERETTVFVSVGLLVIYFVLPVIHVLPVNLRLFGLGIATFATYKFVVFLLYSPRMSIHAIHNSEDLVRSFAKNELTDWHCIQKGAYLYAERGKKRLLVQGLFRYRPIVSADIQKLADQVVAKNATTATLVTNAHITDEAIETAKACKIEIRAR